VTHVPVFLITSPRALRSLRFARFLSTGAIIKFSGSKKNYLRSSSAAPGCFLPVLLRETGKNARKAALLSAIFGRFFPVFFFAAKN
jgi:hypothetical protein